ncbi:MAG: D-glycero-beta-D-manno-heptose 1-phosphate adenylyltransferase [Calditrichota bacterium]
MLRDKIKVLPELIRIRQQLKTKGRRVVFTNGVFDILHRGHVEYLEKARSLGDVLMVGLNSDESVKKIKGKDRPIMLQEDRAMVLAGLSSVDFICFFEEETPENLIRQLIPDILVKGSDYKIDDIVGREIVEANGGRVVTVDLVPGQSTTSVIEKMMKLAKRGNAL